VTHRARDAASGAIVADRLRPATTHWARLRGLLGTTRLDPGDGLWLVPCRQVHTIGMRYPIDVVFLDGTRRVVRRVSALSPGRLSPRVVAAHSVLELPAGTLEKVGLDDGTLIEIDGTVSARQAGRAGRVATIACNLLLAALFLFFALVHLRAAQRTGRWLTTMPTVAQEAIMVALFVVRRRSWATSDRPLDWFLGIVGTFVPLLLRPTRRLETLGLGAPLQIGGLLVVLTGLVFLGRSLGVVAADRGLKTTGPYGLVRHPMYVGYVLGYAGYVVSHPSLSNALLVAVTIAALYGRAIVEERFLVRRATYRQYRTQVPWRFVPGVY
jgi:protein-S-isoprenylcysteine O-methyltransferase Ste14/uncharacterized membrane protein (UPF0127 family)